MIHKSPLLAFGGYKHFIWPEKKLPLDVMSDAALHPRFLLPRLTEALADTPVVLIHGPRQCGKTTLARQVGDAAGYAYISFDDDVRRASAEADPVGFIADLPEIRNEGSHVTG